MVNTKASQHSKLAWCWGELNQLEDLAHTLCTHDDAAITRIGNLLASRVMPLLSMLEHLSEVSCVEKGVSSIDTPGGEQQTTVANEPCLYAQGAQA